MTAGVKALHVLVSGRVQGVAFRWHTRDAARAIGVRGWVRNVDDGRVEVHCEGPEDKLELFLAFLAEGPPASRVTGLEREPAGTQGADSFEIVR
ncbi:MAG: acylphosphatase [bacterium]|nr:acylphosphatase [bacterium]